MRLKSGGGGYFAINSYGGVRRKDFCYDPIPEFLSDIDTQFQNFEEVTKTIRRQRDKGSGSGNDNFCPKRPLERSSDLSMFLNTKNTEICSPETDHVMLEELSNGTFIQHPLPKF